MLTIIGCGNPNRSDDGVGVFVARTLLEDLRHDPRQNVRVFDAGTGGMEVMFQARGAAKVVIVDASCTGTAPGAVFKVPGQELALERAPSFTLHDFRWDHALAAGRRIFKQEFPLDVTVFLIEAESLEFGFDLSEAVRAGAHRVLDDLRSMIAQYQGV